MEARFGRYHAQLWATRQAAGYPVMDGSLGHTSYSFISDSHIFGAHINMMFYLSVQNSWNVWTVLSAAC